MTVTDEQRSKLLELMVPFKDDQIGKLPRVTCKDCSDRRAQCKQHQEKRCEECGAYVSTRHIHIDYVGHAHVTERLLEVDPEWSWEPLERDVDPQVWAAALATGNPDVIQMVLESAPPKFDLDDFGNPVGLWIKLTICGVTRPGYGSCPSKQSDAVKVLIGDALRNAAQRFGVALEQWMKGDRANPAAENAVADAGTRAMPARQKQADAAVVVDANWVAEFEKRLGDAPLEHVSAFRQDVVDAMRTQRINSETANRLLAAVKQRVDALESVTATGLPANKDGSVSRSKLTDEELEANGLMTRQQVKDHNKLAKDTIANPKKAERSNGVDAEDERWMNGGAKS
ncbi:hypothetical protein ABGB18_11355 [Nonomuraea sp. B12E4]|uniref:hypothetical protein n=1 Tax=Nonomuraea sp. B12E4 TaxID=3153564 RepID=UPI00325E017A